MKVLSIPHVDKLGKGESGIHSVVRAYFKHAPKFGIEFVTDNDEADLVAVHAGMAKLKNHGIPIVAHLHGFYWTGDYSMGSWAHHANKSIVESMRQSSAVTVPSEWVAKTVQRDFRINPYVLPHGIDTNVWKPLGDDRGYVVLYAKNRAGFDVCDPTFITDFAKALPNQKFVATFAPNDAPENVTVTGLIPHDEMRLMVGHASAYVSTTKETFGIGMLEAVSSGVPVVAFDEGGVPQFVKHGVNGYLATPGDYQDLLEGLVYCLSHRKVLGVNAVEVAKEFTWDKAMGKLEAIYRHTIDGAYREPSVSIVIPVYKKSAEELERAIHSAVTQTVRPKEVIVVDDGSEMGLVYADICAVRGAKYIHQENQGVASARNTGIALTTAKYVCCLDADDWLDPQFLEACVPELEADPSLGAAYTGLHWHKPDGSEGLSLWPGDYDYDRFLKKQNQVPTCAVFRRDCWEKLGGYRNRYTYRGAGTEDAEFFLRMGAMGYGAKKVTTAGLFHYSWMSGHTSRAGYREPDWLSWHPWVKDQWHPLPSLATPINKIAHPAFQYDSPAVSVIIPVGPGHEQYVADALDSLEAQTFRFWEAVVVWDSDAYPKQYLQHYPYIKFVGQSRSRGAGFARNAGVDVASAPFITFLDADDWLYPTALEDMVMGWQEHEAIMYGDYTAIATVEDVSLLSPKDQNNLLQYNEQTREALINYSLADYNISKAMRQPENPPFIWCNVTTLMPKAWHIEIGGFDETMPSWEDVDYNYRLAWAGKPFRRIAKPLLVYRFNSGSRRDQGIKQWDKLIEYIRGKRNV